MKETPTKEDVSRAKNPQRILEPSTFDRLSAWMVAANILFGFLLLVVAAVWFFTAPNESVVDWPDPIRPTSIDAGDEQNENQDLTEFDIPDMKLVSFDRLNDALPKVQDVVAAVGSRQANTGDGSQGGGGLGGGPGRIEEIPEPPTPTQRWSVSYSARDFESYVEQLSFFKIEIGVVHQTEQQIIRIRDFDETPTTTMSSREVENSAGAAYFLHQKNRLKRWDVAIAKSAGASTVNSFTVQFFPESTLKLMANAEQEYLAQVKRELLEVEKTEFKLEPIDDGYQFVVQNVTYR